MKDPNDGDLLIVGDRNQGISGPKSVVWSKVGVNARGRSVSAAFDLDKNYRNSREILELAACFAEDQAGAADEDHFGVVPVDPAKALRSTGVRPLLIREGDRAGECRAVVDMVRQLLRHDGKADPRVPRPLQPGEIGILYPHLSQKLRPTFEVFVKELGQVAPVVWLSDSDRSRGDSRKRVGEPGIKVQTIHSSKGLQYPAVFLLWADLLPRFGDSFDPAGEAKLMYVGRSFWERWGYRMPISPG